MEINPKYINLDLYDKKQTGIFEIPKLINFIKGSNIVMGDKVNITLEIIPINETTFKKKIILEGKIKIILEEEVQKSDFEFLRDELLKLNKTVVQEFQNINSKFDNLETKVDNLETKVDNLETKVDNLETRVVSLETKVDNVETTLRTEIKDSEKRVMDYVDKKFDEHVKKYHSK